MKKYSYNLIQKKTIMPQITLRHYLKLTYEGIYELLGLFNLLFFLLYTK
jgi:hypothetical protein